MVPGTRISKAGRMALTEMPQGDGEGVDPAEEGSGDCRFRLHGFKPIVGLTCKAEVQNDISVYLREHGVVIEDGEGGGLIMKVRLRLTFS